MMKLSLKKQIEIVYTLKNWIIKKQFQYMAQIFLNIIIMFKSMDLILK